MRWPAVRRFTVAVAAEIAPLYVAGWTVLLLLLLTSFLLSVFADALSRGAPPGLVAAYLLLRLPSAASAGMTLALLFAALLALSRMSADGELRAALSLGLGPSALLVPMLACGVGVAGLAAVNDAFVVPWAEERAAQVQKDILLQAPATLLREGAFLTDARGRSLFVGGLERGNRATDVVIVTPGGLDGPRNLIEASHGTVDDRGGTWLLEDVRMRALEDGRPSLDVVAATASVPLRDVATAATGRRDLVTLRWSELLARSRADPGDPAVRTAVHRKVAEPLAGVAFAVFALAIALFGVRRNVSVGIVAVLLLTFLYYATWSVAKLLGAQGALHPAIAGWAPVASYGIVGSILLTVAWRR